MQKKKKITKGKVNVVSCMVASDRKAKEDSPRLESDSAAFSFRL